MAGPAPFGEVERTLAWRYLRATRANGGVSVVSIISFVGIMLAVMALIVIMSVMSGFRSTLLDALLGGQGHVFVQVEKHPGLEIDELSAKLSTLDEVEVAMPVLQGQVLADTGERQSGAVVRGVRMQDLDKLPFLNTHDEAANAQGIVTGGEAESRSLGFGEGKNGGDVIFIGRFLANDLRVYPGSKITLVTPKGIRGPFGVSPRKKTFTIGGLFQTGSVELDKLYIIMPMQQSQLFFGKADKYDLIDIRVPEPMITEPAVKAVNDATGNRYAVNDWKLEKAAYFGALNTERGMMMIIMLILIVITSLNIITGVVMLVKNKTRDIAILRTIGAGRGSVMRVFIMIGAMLGLTGALIGAALGVLIVVNIGVVEDMISFVLGRPLFPPTVYGLDGLPAELNWGEVGFVTFWAMGMSMLVTIWPAWSAAKLDPVEALRFE